MYNFKSNVFVAMFLNDATTFRRRTYPYPYCDENHRDISDVPVIQSYPSLKDLKFNSICSEISGCFGNAGLGELNVAARIRREEIDEYLVTYIRHLIVSKVSFT